MKRLLLLLATIACLGIGYGQPIQIGPGGGGGGGTAGPPGPGDINASGSFTAGDIPKSTTTDGKTQATSGLQFSSLRNVQLQTSGDNPNIAPVSCSGNGSEDAIQTINPPDGYGTAQLVWHCSAAPHTWVRPPLLLSGAGSPNLGGYNSGAGATCAQVGDVWFNLSSGLPPGPYFQCLSTGTPGLWMPLSGASAVAAVSYTPANGDAGTQAAIAAFGTGGSSQGGKIILPCGKLSITTASGIILS